MPRKPPTQTQKRRDDAKTLMQRYPDWFFEAEDRVLDDPEEYRWEVDCGTPEDAKSLQMRFFRFRSTMAHPKNQDRWLADLPNTMGLQVTVRGSKLVFRDINLYSDRFIALQEGRPPKTRKKEGFLSRVAEDAVSVDPLVAEARQAKNNLLEQMERELQERKARVAQEHPLGPIHQEPAAPPAPRPKAEDPEFWKRYPPMFRSILMPLAKLPEWTVEGTGFASWPKQWLEVQRELGEPWSRIELTLTDRAAVFRWLTQGEPTEE